MIGAKLAAMTQTLFSITIAIPAPPEIVWRVMADVERWPEWTPSVRRVKLLTPGPLHIGSRARIHQPGFPPASWRVTELEAGKGFTWISTAPGLRVTARHEIESTNGGSCGTLSIRYAGLFGPLMARWTRHVNNRYLAMEADGLRRRCISI
jgi:uncharacterized membrane protein